MKKEQMSEEQKNVLNAVLHMTSSFHDKDMEGVMASYESHAVVVFEPETPVSDPLAVREGFDGFFGLNPRFDYSGHEVFVKGDIAVHLAPWTMTGTAPDGTQVTQSGLSVAVLRKQSDGKWLMVIDDPYGQYLMDQQ